MSTDHAQTEDANLFVDLEEAQLWHENPLQRLSRRLQMRRNGDWNPSVSLDIID